MKDPLLDGISKVSQANEFSFEADNLSKSILKGFVKYFFLKIFK